MIPSQSAHSESLVSNRGTAPATVASRLSPKSSQPLAPFKYYIHDAVDSFRLQLFGHLSETNLKELNGCWTTATTSLGGRKVILDLRHLLKVDEAGAYWIDSMAAEGAVVVPETFSAQASEAALDPVAPLQSSGLLTRLLMIVRGSRTIPAQSPTQAQ